MDCDISKSSLDATASGVSDATRRDLQSGDSSTNMLRGQSTSTAQHLASTTVETNILFGKCKEPFLGQQSA
ncbi:hypothetical protein CEXT_659671 [Caerostris extrusa]|uniref:Uncharacterized protein n=1 Tax=Caerostris extrusa TaxID=172846 RepID=A0AAV4PI65_CAEEX|nr:hypothetical protein CEXT_659671 [Caerostris extrusa]